MSIDKAVKVGQPLLGMAVAAKAASLGDPTAVAKFSLNAGKLWQAIRKSPQDVGLDNSDTLDKIQEQIKQIHLAEIERYGGDHEGEFKAWLEVADEKLTAVLEGCILSTEDFASAAATANGFQKAAITLIMARLGDAIPEYFSADREGYHVYKYGHAVVSACVNAVAEQKDYFAKMQPHLILEIASTVARIDERVARMEGALAEKSKLEEALTEQTKLLNRIYGDKEKTERELKKLQEKHHFSQAKISGLLKNVLNEHVGPDQIEAALERADAQFTDMAKRLQTYERFENEIPNIRRPLEFAQAALSDPDFSDLKGLDDALLKIQEEYEIYAAEQDQKEDAARNKRNEIKADILVTRAKSAQAQSSIDEAVALYDEAIEKVVHNLELLLGYMWGKGELSYGFGIISPEIDMLLQSAGVWEEMLKLSPKTVNPKYWSRLKIWQGLIWFKIGER